ncbi:hypothetical protein ATANTOWER_018286, partial [Ataeniobius toweri]|nr:hypothetical protein [Ataeniobius toweri]
FTDVPHEINRSKMWILVFLCMLSLNITQAPVRGSSTQMYYATLIIDRSAINKTYESLQKFKANDSQVTISEIKMTTVGVTGNIHLDGDGFKGCLTVKSSESYRTCNDNLTNAIQREYSLIRGFDTLGSLEYSVGSVIVNFAMKFASAVDSQNLFERSITLGRTLSGSLTLETTGFVSLKVPSYSVPYNSSVSMECTTEEDLNAKPKWTLKRKDGDFLITNGSISTVSISPKNTTVSLKQVNELWEGEYVCLFVQEKNGTAINHRANATMDICLIPIIETSAEPAFPLCKKDSDIFLVTVKCKIKKSSENYTVTWNNDATPKDSTEEDDTQTYSAEKLIDCKRTSSSGSASPSVSCTFINQCNQTQTQHMMVSVIYVGDKYCVGDGDWGHTKANFTAQIKCHKQAGTRKRKCLHIGEGKWQEEVSECVEKKLYDVLESAKISDIGLGELSLNAAIVFERFKNVTKTSTLLGYANLDTSVTVLITMNEKLSNSSLTNQTAIDDFLLSSSHLLNKSLESSWNTTPPENPSSSTAERYMLSVEKLISKSNIIAKTRNENLEALACNVSSNCNISVFNTTVSLSDAENVKTTGFKHLENYLPCNNKSVPNSIVVSTTAENKSEVKISIDFQLTNPRPRNVELHCVFWNTTLNAWSTDGCKWEGNHNEGRCVCEHLSSFAILMSKEPLEVPGLNYVTYVALSVSVLSLISNLVIELIVWSDVVKTSTLYLRHIAHVNISLCLLIADLCFLASSDPKNISDLWCRTSVVLKHFCYLAMFFWMFCLSATLLHQAVFLFHKVSKKNYLRFSMVIGYFCPLLIVVITFLTNDGGIEGKYYSKDTCWLVYGGLFEGTIYTFIIPVGAIVFINVFSMLVVIMKLISHHTEIQQKTEISPEKEKAAAKTVMRSVILLTPIFGVTWIFGFAMLVLDLTSGPLAYAVHYIFTVANGFQGLFILLTTCFGDRMTREALRKYFNKKAPASSVSESSTTMQSKLKK